MKYSTIITPLNCNYSVQLNSILRMEESEYIADATRSIYCKNPDLSWFKMKSATTTPYLEPAFFGLQVGDVISVEFDALIKSGTGSVTANFIKILSGGSTGESNDQALPTGSLKSHYKRFKIKTVIKDGLAGGIGIIVNLRPTGTNNEMILKNVEVIVETKNETFGLNNNIVRYENKIDYMNVITLYSGTDSKTSYNGLYDLFIEGNVLFPDANTVNFNGGVVGKFRGLMAEFPKTKYANPAAVYMEYKVDNAQLPAAYLTYYDTEGNVIGTPTGIQFPETSGAWKKKILYFAGIHTPSEKTFFDVGLLNATPIYSFKNVRFSNPRFDDYIKKNPNQLEDLYTNLGLKLRGIS